MLADVNGQRAFQAREPELVRQRSCGSPRPTRIPSVNVHGGVAATPAMPTAPAGGATGPGRSPACHVIPRCSPRRRPKAEPVYWWDTGYSLRSVRRRRGWSHRRCRCLRAPRWREGRRGRWGDRRCRRRRRRGGHFFKRSQWHRPQLADAAEPPSGCWARLICLPSFDTLVGVQELGWWGAPHGSARFGTCRPPHSQTCEQAPNVKWEYAPAAHRADTPREWIHTQDTQDITFARLNTYGGPSAGILVPSFGRNERPRNQRRHEGDRKDTRT
jgi:hypothetical protein